MKHSLISPAIVVVLTAVSIILEAAQRPDRTDAWPLKPVVGIRGHKPLFQNWLQVQSRTEVSLGWELPQGASNIRLKWSRTPPSGPVDPKDCGAYVLNGSYELQGRTVEVKDCTFFLDVQEKPIGSPFSWEGRVPKFSHDWSKDAKYKFGKFSKPVENLGDVPDIDRFGKPVMKINGEWWTVAWGSGLNSICGKYDSPEVIKCAKNMLAAFDADFRYIREQMGWPPDLRIRNGYRSLIYIFGSGLPHDHAPNTEAGGYQGAIWFKDPKTGIAAHWPCVWASFHPFSRFRDDADKRWRDGEYQRGAMIHEGIHAIFADLGTCRKSCWFHEAGNTWLQAAMVSERDHKFGLPGFLDVCPFIAPFMPIECYSGWLQDGSFGGPAAEGVNRHQPNGKQICTWRNLLGGTQYANVFPVVLAEICGKGSIPWIWRNCPDYVLKGIGEHLGDETMRELILQYRSRMATFDIGGWKQGYRDLLNRNFGVMVKAEWEPFWIDVPPFRLTPYQGVSPNSPDGWQAPDPLTNPGWSGANIIPLEIVPEAPAATIEFRPEDLGMRAQLCYVTKSGKAYYSTPVHCGKTQLSLSDRPANEVIFCVVANTDYIFSNADHGSQRKKHFDYRLRMCQGIHKVANLYTKWNLNENDLRKK